MNGPDPIDPADEREWEIHKAFEKKDKEIAALRARAEKAEAQLCMAREAFIEIVNNCGCADDVDFCMNCNRANDAIASLSSSTPCPHEGLAVIHEEFDELKAEVWKKKIKRDPTAMVKEARQVAAMGLRFMVDIALPKLLKDPSAYRITADGRIKLVSRKK